MVNIGALIPAFPAWGRVRGHICGRASPRTKPGNPSGKCAQTPRRTTMPSTFSRPERNSHAVRHGLSRATGRYLLIPRSDLSVSPRIWSISRRLSRNSAEFLMVTLGLRHGTQRLSCLICSSTRFFGMLISWLIVPGRSNTLFAAQEVIYRQGLRAHPPALVLLGGKGPSGFFELLFGQPLEP